MEQMTPEQAIEFIRSEIQIDVLYADVPKTEHVLNMAISALEKQVPKKAIRKANDICFAVRRGPGLFLRLRFEK